MGGGRAQSNNRGILFVEALTKQVAPVMFGGVGRKPIYLLVNIGVRHRYTPERINKNKVGRGAPETNLLIIVGKS